MQFKPAKVKVDPEKLPLLILPIGGALLAIGLHLFLPNVYPDGYVPKIYVYVQVAGLIAYIVIAATSFFLPSLHKKVLYWAPWVCAVFLGFEFLDIMTLKTGIFQMPLMPNPDRTMYSYVRYWDGICKNFWDTMVRLAIGLTAGGLLGFFCGLMMGWSKIWNYWLAPLMKVIGPLPSIAWIPIVVSFTPSSRTAGLLLISIAMWFPMTLMLSSGIKAVPKKQVERARTLGASERYILFHVALPSATETIFTGIFMGLSNSFSALMVAETLGVKAGIGWYVNFAVTWSDYGLAFACIGICILIFFILITICFKIRDHIMKWRKGVVRW